MATIKKKRVSKKTRASWRKHSNIKDVEDFLDEQRQEERIGTFTEKKDEELFQVDVQVPVKKILSEKKKRKGNARRPLKSLQALENTSKVQDPIVKRNHVKNKKNGRNKEEEILNPKTQKHIEANKDRMKYYEKLDKKLSKEKKAKEFAKDIWVEEEVRDRLPGLNNDWISKDLSTYILQKTGKGAIKVHSSIRHKTTKAKSFEEPHPGISYNPSLSAHKDLIEKVVEKEVGIIKEEKHLKRVTTDMFSKVTAQERDALHLKEMSSGLDEGEGAGEGTENDANDDLPYKPVNPPVENKKKSKQKKRKQKEKRVMNNELKKKELLKKQRIDIHRLKTLKEEVLKEEEELNQIKKRRKVAAKKKKFEPKRLGRLKFQEPDVDVSMPEEISGNLRNVKVQSSLLVDRFKNFQKRNILPTTKELGKRKPRKIKRFPRSSHKEPGVTLTEVNQRIKKNKQ